MRSRLAVGVAIAAAACVSGAGDCFADAIAIENGSFESPSVGIYNYPGPVDGWTLSGASGGVWNINASPLGFWNVHAPDGQQVGWLSPAPSQGSGPAAISQTLVATYAANTVYSLSGYVGHPIGFGSSTGTSFTAELLAGTTVIASFSGAGPEGSFVPFSAASLPGTSLVGQALSIVLMDNQAQTAFDDIRLNAVVVPLPGAAFAELSGLVGIAGLGIVRRRAMGR